MERRLWISHPDTCIAERVNAHDLLLAGFCSIEKKPQLSSCCSAILTGDEGVRISQTDPLLAVSHQSKVRVRPLRAGRLLINDKCTFVDDPVRLPGQSRG